MDRILRSIYRTALLAGLGLILPSWPGPGLDIGNAQPLPDPTRPPQSGSRAERSAAKAEQSPPSWELTFIVHSPQRKLAVINGNIKRPGDRVEGARILSIKRDFVILSYRGKRRVLRLFPEGATFSRTGNEQGDSP